MPVSRKTQRNGTFGRLTNVTADRGKMSGKQSTDPGDNLDSGDGSEEDGVDNRSEPQDWLTDGSADSADPAQDGKSGAAVKTAPPLLGAGSRTDSPATDRETTSSAAADDTADPIPGLTAERGGWDTTGRSGSSTPGSHRSGSGSSHGSGNGSYGSRGAGSRGAGSSDRTESSTSASRPPSGAGPGSPVGAAAGVAAGVSGAAAMSAPYAPPDGSRGAPPVTAPFPNPTKSRPKPQRSAKAPRTQQQQFNGQRSAPAGFPAQGSASNRKAQLAISRIEPWSVMKFSFMISLVGWVILFVAVALMYFVLQKIGVFTSIEHTVGLVTASKNRAGTDAASWFSSSRVLGYTMLIGAVNVILITALATIGAVLYNLVTMLAGGIEVTLKETE
jgi:hypothetical protein